MYYIFDYIKMKCILNDKNVDFNIREHRMKFKLLSREKSAIFFSIYFV
jgi:hypothetical protein